MSMPNMPQTPSLAAHTRRGHSTDRPKRWGEWAGIFRLNEKGQIVEPWGVAPARAGFVSESEYDVLSVVGRSRHEATSRSSVRGPRSLSAGGTFFPPFILPLE